MATRLEQLKSAQRLYMQAAGQLQQAIRQANVSGMDAASVSERIGIATEHANLAGAELLAAQTGGTVKKNE